MGYYYARLKVLFEFLRVIFAYILLHLIDYILSNTLNKLGGYTI